MSLDLDEPTKLRPTLRPFDIRVRSRARTALKLAGIGLLAVIMLVYGFYYALTTPWMLVQFMLPLGGMILLVIWMLPEARQPPTTMMERLFFALLVVMFLWPNYLAFAFSGLPWITLIRLTGFPMVLSLLVCISVSKTFRDEISEVIRAAPWLTRAVIAFATIMLLSVAMSQTAMASVQKLIVGAVNWIAIYFVSAYILSKPGRMMRWATILLIAVLAVSVVGVLEARFSKIPWSGNIPSFVKVDPLVSSILSGSYRTATGEYRVKGTSTTALGFAEFLAISMPFVMHLAFGPFSRRIRWVAFATVPLAFVVIESTGSRLGMVGSGIGVLLYTFAWSYHRWRSQKMGLVGPAMLMAYPALASLVLVASFTVTRLRTRVWGGGATAASDAGRQMQIDVALPKIANNPIGYGIGRAAETLGIRGSGDKLTIDNYYLAIALEYGIIGFIVFYGMLVLGIVYGVRGFLKRSDDPEVSFLIPCAISMTSFFVVKWVFAQQDNHPLIFMMLGATCALCWRLRKEAQESKTAATAAIAPKALPTLQPI